MRGFVREMTELQPALRAFVGHLLVGSGGVSDVVQEVNMLLWEKRDNFQPGTNFRAWAFTAARYVVLGQRRRLRKQGLMVFDLDLLESLADEWQAQPDENERKLAALESCVSRNSRTRIWRCCGRVTAGTGRSSGWRERRNAAAAVSGRGFSDCGRRSSSVWSGNWKSKEAWNDAEELERMTQALTDEMPSEIEFARLQGGVSFWIRRPPGKEREEILWLAGDGAVDQTRNPARALIHTRLSASGRVELCIENGAFDVLLSSNFSIVDGRWHHIAASWGPAAVELYVDGGRVARADDFGKLHQGIMRGSYVRFGKPSDDQGVEGRKPFAGDVDEIAVWNRPLTGTEIAHQFMAARGAATEPRRNVSRGDSRAKGEKN